MEELELLYFAGGDTMSIITFGNSLVAPYQVSIHITYAAIFRLLDIYPKDMKDMSTQKHMH